MNALDVIVPKIAALLAKVGRSIDYLSTPLSSYDVASGKVLTGDHTATPVVSTPPLQFSKRYDGDTIKRDDLAVFIQPTLTPAVGNRLRIDSQTYNIVNVMPLYTGTLIAAFKLQLRK